MILINNPCLKPVKNNMFLQNNIQVLCTIYGCLELDIISPRSLYWCSYRLGLFARDNPLQKYGSNIQLHATFQTLVH